MSGRGKPKQKGRKPSGKATGKTGASGHLTEVSAGGIVYRRTPEGVRIGFILDPYGKWSFAKGHVEKGETVRDAAVRETREEMGIRKLRVKARLGRIEIWFRDNYRPETRGRLVHKYVHFFLMEAPSAVRGRPQKSEHIRRIIWVRPEKAMAQSSYKDVREIIEKAISILKRQERGRGSPPAAGKRGGGKRPRRGGGRKGASRDKV